jgi:hypothetical protein
MSFHQDSFHQKNKVTDREAEIWWEKYMRKDPEVLSVAVAKAGFDTNSDEYYEIETVHWADLPISARTKLVKHWNKLLRKALRDL